MLIHADRGDAVETGRVVNEQTLALGQHGVVGGVPPHRQGLGDPRHGQMLHDQRFQSPPQCPAGDLGLGLCRGGGVLAPHVSAVDAPVTAHRDHQGRGPPAQRLVRQIPDHDAPWGAMGSAAVAPVIRFDHPAGQHGPAWFQALAGGHEAEFVQPAELGQVTVVEGSVRHVEVFQMACVGTSICGRPRPLSSYRRAASPRPPSTPSFVMSQINDRAVPGHWEGDLIVGTGGSSAIVTLVEPSTRYEMLGHLPGGHTAEAVRDVLVGLIGYLTQHLRGSLTWDQGAEMSRHKQFTVATGVPVYFCDPHSPWQRGSNENTNGLLCQYFPKGIDLGVYSPADLKHVAQELNG